MHQKLDIKTIWLFLGFSDFIPLSHRVHIVYERVCVCVCVCVCARFLPPIGVEASDTLRAVLSNPLHAAFL